MTPSQRVYAASTDPTTKLVFGRKSELWLVVDVDDPPGIDEGEFSCQASRLHTCSVDEAAMLAQPGCSPYIVVSAPSTNVTFRVPHVPRAQTPWASHHATSRLYFRHVVNDEDPNLANCNYITTAFGILEYITLDNATHAPSGYFEVEPDPPTHSMQTPSSTRGMRFASAKAGAKRTVSLADLVFSPCKRSLTSPSGCEPGVTSVGVDTLPPRMVGVSTRKDPKSVFYSGDAIDIAVLFTKPVIFVDNNSAALDACRPTLRTNFGTLEFLPREEFNAIVQGNVAGRQQIVFRRSVEPEDGLYESIEIEKPYDTAVNATGCSPAATGMVVPVALSKIAGFYPLENQNNPFEAWVKFSNITVGLAPGRIGDVDILVTFSKPVDYQILLDPLNVQDAAKTREARLYGTPRIALNTLAYAYLLGYANPDTKVGEGTPEGEYLDVLSVDAFDSYGGILRTAGNALDVILGLPAPGAEHGLSDSRVTVEKTGRPAMPFGYDPSQPPTEEPVALIVDKSSNSGGRQRTRHVLASSLDVSPQPVRVEVTVQINSVIDVSTKDQSMKVDLTLLQEWFDSRFKYPNLAPIAENDTSILNAIWSPRLTFVNVLSKPDGFDGKVIRFNNGTVRLYQRFIQDFAVDINVKDFPFDIQLRSNSFDGSQLTFAPITGAKLNGQEANMRGIVDPSWTYESYKQEVETTDTGINAGYDILTTSFRARRIRTYNVINLLVPLLLISISVIFSLFQPVESENRTVACETALLGTLGFSFVLADLSPPVSYMTKMGAFTFQAYAFSIVGLAVNVAFGHLVWVVNELRRMDDGGKGDDRERIFEHIYEAVLKFKGSQPQAAPASAVDAKAASASPRGQTLAPIAPQPNVQLLQTAGRVPVAPSAGALGFPTPTEASIPNSTAINMHAADAEHDAAARIMTHRTPGTGSTALTRFFARSGSIRLQQIAASAEVAPAPGLGDIVFKDGLLTTRATEEEARNQPPPAPDPKRLAGFFVPPVLPRRYHVFDIYGIRFGELRVQNREVYIERLREVNAWVRAAFIVAFVASTACIFTVAP
eukprot:tig00021070_g17905.t1